MKLHPNKLFFQRSIIRIVFCNQKLVVINYSKLNQLFIEVEVCLVLFGREELFQLINICHCFFGSLGAEEAGDIVGLVSNKTFLYEIMFFWRLNENLFKWVIEFEVLVSLLKKLNKIGITANENRVLIFQVFNQCCDDIIRFETV